MHTPLHREIIAGLSSFFTMAYLLLLYPQILSEGGIDFGAALTATTIIAILSTAFLAFYADFPAVLFPGLSVGTYLVYSLMLKQQIPWQTVLGFAFWAGFLLFLLSLFKVRQKILLHLPASMKAASISGIGLFLIAIGIKNLSIAPLETSIALFGLLLFIVLYRLKIAASFLLSIFACWGLALFFDLTSWKGFAALPPPLSPTWLQLDLLTPLSPSSWGILLSVLLLSLIDSSASLTALAHLGPFLNQKGEIRKIDQIVITDGLGSIIGSLLGTGGLSFLLESSSGIKAGGRTKKTALTAATCCLVALFLFPLLSSIPLFATAPALLAVGFFMACNAKNIRWKDWTEALPALLTILTIPLTFSIYQGFSLGFVSFTLLKGATRRWKEVHPICWGLSLIFAAQFIRLLA